MSPPPLPAPTGSSVADYDYELPAGRIARYPADRRDDSRLLVVARDGSPTRDLRFRDIVDLPAPGDVMVVNESRVMPVRLLGRKPTGAPAEILLLRQVTSMGGGERLGAEKGAAQGGEEGTGDEGTGGAGTDGAGTGRAEAGRAEKSRVEGRGGSGRVVDSALSEENDGGLWEALVRPGGKLKPGRLVEVSPELTVEIVDSTADGGRIVRLRSHLAAAEALSRFGHMPLPPYIDREDEPLDRERYQTVYAREPGSVAAPTAGLHFTEALLDELAVRGLSLARVTLHVGIGTFRPVEVDDPARHVMHSERFHVPPAAADMVNRCRSQGGNVWAVGTTVVRTLESAVGDDGRVRPGSGETRLFIRPPFRFQVVDRLVTNFHLPRSTLLMLVAALAGYERTMAAYAEAIRLGFRFYSYGDAMVIV